MCNPAIEAEKPFKVVAPTGAEIVGTLDALGLSCAYVMDGVLKVPSGLEYEHQGGTNTDDAHNGQATVTVNGRPVFVDENGFRWRADQLVDENLAPAHEVGPDSAPIALPTYQELLDAYFGRQMEEVA